MMRQQTMQMVLNEEWTVCCVVMIGLKLGGNRHGLQYNQKICPHVEIDTFLPMGIPLS